MASGKWSWRYKFLINGVLGDQGRDDLFKLCCEKFGSGLRGKTWDISYIKRRNNPKSWFPRYRYQRVKLHFKHQEDLVLFKLCYNPLEV